MRTDNKITKCDCSKWNIMKDENDDVVCCNYKEPINLHYDLFKLRKKD